MNRISSVFYYALLLSVVIFIEGCDHSVSPDNADNNEQQRDSLKIDSSSKASLNADTSESDDLRKVLTKLESSYAEKFELDTSANFKNDKVHIVFKNYCLYDSSLVIPEKFVSSYGMKELITNAFQSSLSIQVNGINILDTLVNKSFFKNELSDYETLDKYGVLSYRDLEIFDNHLDVTYTIAVPLTDLGRSVTLHSYYDGKVTITKGY